MFRFTTCFVIIFAVTVGVIHAEDLQPGLTLKQAQELLSSIQLDARTRTAINAVTNNDIRDLALNRDVLAVNDDIFSFKLPTKGITDQASSGRCWMFAGLNLMRQEVIKKYDLDDFELSQSYLAFWDLLEKSNVFLEYIIETRDRDILDRELDKRLEDPVGDGGYWDYVVNIVEKYGVVPKKFMDETHSSANTRRMQQILRALLLRDAATLRSQAAQGKPVEELRAGKSAMLQDVMRVLVINYGMPPTEFEWRTTDSTGKADDPVIYTPQKFYSDVIGADLSNYVSLASYPIHPFGKNYSINTTQSMADKHDVSFINIDEKQMKGIALAALLDSNRVWFGCDMSHDVYSKKGLMVKGVYNYEELFGIDIEMTKTERLNFRDQSSNHAMVLTGVDVMDGKPRKWLVENSWGKERGDNGLFTMSDDWFDEYVLNVIVPKQYVPAKIMAIADEKPTPLPIWDPAWRDLGF
ncbi:C1 family peptidase [bacterium]|nr:C1 family peptidase [bacterium]